MDVEFVTGEPGGDVEVLARFALEVPPPLAAGDRVLIGDERYVLLDADWTVGELGQQGFQAVRFYLDKADGNASGLGIGTGEPGEGETGS